MANVINFDPVAVAIDGPKHRAELFRVLAYAATQGSEGVIAPYDCRVLDLFPTPGPQIRIQSGAVAIRNRSSNIDNQTYIANNRLETRLDVAPTGATGRTDLVIVRLRDPQYSPWTSVIPQGADINTFQYAEPLIIQNVPAGTTSALDLNLGYSAYALAKITIPPNTTNITQAMITTLRKVAVQRRTDFFKRQDVPNGTEPFSSATEDTWLKFPPSTAIPDISIPIPDFATKAKIRIDITGLSLFSGNFSASWQYRMFLGTDIITSANTFMNETEASLQRLSFVLSDDMTIPDTLRGKTVTGRLELMKHDGAGRLQANGGTQVSTDIVFYGSAI